MTARFTQKVGRTQHVRKAIRIRPEPDLIRLYEAIGLDHLPGGVQKFVT
jgi:hypothetical protein